MEDKENWNVSDIRNSIEVLQNEQRKLEFYLQDLVKLRKCMEQKSDDANFELSKLNEDIHRINATNKINEYKADLLEAEAKELEKESETLRAELENLRNQLKQQNEKSNAEVIQIEKETDHLCQLFYKGVRFNSRESVEEETRKMSLEIEEHRKEYNELLITLEKAKTKLDEVLQYETPTNDKEKELPLGQRKMVMNVLKDALKNAKNQLLASRQVIAEKETELRKLG